MRNTLRTEFGDTMVFDEDGSMLLFIAAPMDKMTFRLTRSIPLPSSISELDEYLIRRRLLVLHVLTFLPRHIKNL